MPRGLVFPPSGRAEHRSFRREKPEGESQGRGSSIEGQEPLRWTLAESDNFAWSKVEQPQAGPQGENHGWFS